MNYELTVNELFLLFIFLIVFELFLLSPYIISFLIFNECICL